MCSLEWRGLCILMEEFLTLAFGSARLVGRWVSINSVMYTHTLVVHSLGQRQTSSSNTLLWSQVHEIMEGLVSLWRLLLLTCPGTWALCWDYSHYLVSELLEKSALGGFGHEVCNHVSRRAPFHRQLLVLDPVGYKKISDVDMLRPLAARSFAVPLQEDGTLVVLVDDIVSDFISLGFHEISSPAYCWHQIIHTDQFGFRGASCVQLLFCGGGDGKSSSH